MRKTYAHSDKGSTRKKTVIVEGDKLSNSPRHQTPYYTACCSKRDVNMVSSETLPMDDGRAGSIVLTFETHICWKKGKQKQERPSKPHRVLAVSLVEQPP